VSICVHPWLVKFVLIRFSRWPSKSAFAERAVFRKLLLANGLVAAKRNKSRQHTVGRHLLFSCVYHPESKGVQDFMRVSLFRLDRCYGPVTPVPVFLFLLLFL
jgi:hypothetical protein